MDSDSGEYEYKPIRRYVGPLTILGFSTPTPSAMTGEAVAVAYLRHLARHPATARRIATKLAVRFMSDSPPDPGQPAGRLLPQPLTPRSGRC